MADLAAVRVLVYGRVQGVFYRAFVSRWATPLGLTGYVTNRPDGRSVEVRAEGERKQLAALVDHLKVGPPGARVDRIDTEWLEYTGAYRSFEVLY